MGPGPSPQGNELIALLGLVPFTVTHKGLSYPEGPDFLAFFLFCPFPRANEIHICTVFVPILGPCSCSSFCWG